LAAVAARPRRHAEAAAGGVIGARAGAETGGIDRLGDRLTLVEPFGETAEPVRIAPFARRRAGHLLEHAMEMIAADPSGTGQLGEARQGVAASDQAAGAFDRGNVPVSD